MEIDKLSLSSSPSPIPLYLFYTSQGRQHEVGSELDSSTEGVTGLLADTCEFYYMGSWVFELTRFYIRYIHIPRVICSTSRIN